ncbi:hypothetical protein EV356DRAFT_508541 [Viridothelium virens]|uniref:Secreted protein n=1 Tax=Viridothelium virens TaxID=1048519 RepID=A0A6A6HIW0_VIRVR|nr:hypothetical protein EV356DRAFT_508541 [Viridothelium virens]
MTKQLAIAIAMVAPFVRAVECADWPFGEVLDVGVLRPLEDVLSSVWEELSEVVDDELLEVLLVMSELVTVGGAACDPVVIGLTYAVFDDRPVASQ